MSDADSANVVRTRIWREEAEPNNPFVARRAFCRGYDVFGELVGNARWVEMLYMLFKEDPPTPPEADVLEALAVALANPGPRDASVHAAMCGGVCGSPAASSLMAALAVGAGELSGGRDVYLAMQGWNQCGFVLSAWEAWLKAPNVHSGSVWPKPEHAPGFDPHGVSTSTPVRQMLSCLDRFGSGKCLSWLIRNLADLEQMAGCPLALSGVTAAAFVDLGFGPEQGEMLHLLLRLPGAAAHALEQQPLGYKKFPFGTVELESETAKEQE